MFDMISVSDIMIIVTSYRQRGTVSGNSQLPASGVQAPKATCQRQNQCSIFDLSIARGLFPRGACTQAVFVYRKVWKPFVSFKTAAYKFGFAVCKANFSEPNLEKSGTKNTSFWSGRFKQKRRSPLKVSRFLFSKRNGLRGFSLHPSACHCQAGKLRFCTSKAPSHEGAFCLT